MSAVVDADIRAVDHPVDQQGLEARREDESDGSGSDNVTRPAAKKIRKERDPNPPIAPSQLPSHVTRAMHKFVKEVKGFNTRVPGKQYRVSVYCAVVYDAAEKGNKLLHQGRPLTCASTHIDEALRDSCEDVELHRLFQARLVYHHTAQNGQTLARLKAKLDPAHVEASPHAELDHAAASPHAETANDEDLSHDLIEPELMTKYGRSWEERLAFVKDMLLERFNLQHGNEHLEFGKFSC